MPDSQLIPLMREVAFRLNESRKGSNPGVVVIIGAGASRQYGLPDYDHLLLRICYERLFLPTEELERRIAENRSKAIAPCLASLAENGQERTRIVERHLRHVKGANCPAYRYLARLAKDGYLTAIVNLNFDTLIEEAFDEEGVEYEVSRSFQPNPHSFTIHKPNGSLRGGPTLQPLDLNPQFLFRPADQAQYAAELLTYNHVLVLGYSGIDTKIRQALKNFNTSESLVDYKLFIVNTTHLEEDYFKNTQRVRESQDYSLDGQQASFAFFMESLYEFLYLDKTSDRVNFQVPRETSYYAARSECIAIDHIRRLALELLSILHVPDHNSLRLQEHADELFSCISMISDITNTPLTCVEQFIVRSATYLHDLGFFWARSREDRNESPGFELLANHGARTFDLLNHYRQQEPSIDRNSDRLVPSPYATEDKNKLIDIIWDVCRCHSTLSMEDLESTFKKWEGSSIKVHECEVEIRFPLICTLFTLAEELKAGTASTLSTSNLPGIASTSSSIDDPILDLHWDRGQYDVDFDIPQGRVSVDLRAKAKGLLAEWLWHRLETARTNLNSIIRRYGRNRRKLEIVAKDAPTLRREDESDAARRALAEALEKKLQSDHSVTDRASAALDLIAIYHIAPPNQDHSEPRVSIDNRTIKEALKKIAQTEPEAASKSLMYNYLSLQLRPSDRLTRMESYFLASFREILYPAWRWIASGLGPRPDQYRMYQLMLDFGSSRFRSETIFGLQYILRDKIYPPKKPGESRLHEFHYGHRGCMQCTGHLLSIMAMAGERLTADEIRSAAPLFSEYLAGILRFLLHGNLSKEDWMGFYGERDQGASRVRSITYLSAGIRGLLRAYAAEQRSRGRFLSQLEGPRVDSESILRLAAKKWTHFCQFDIEELVESSQEEDTSSTLGDLTYTWLLARDYLDGATTKTANSITELYDRTKTLDNSVIGRFRRIPAMIACCLNEQHEMNEYQLVSRVDECTASPVWIRERQSRGAWGYNMEVTRDLAKALLVFWQHAFSRKSVFEPIFENPETDLRFIGEDTTATGISGA